MVTAARTFDLVKNTVREIIGQANNVIFRQDVFSTSRRPTVSVARSDYSFWDRARNGRVQGLEFGGLFIKPISGKIAEWKFNEQPRLDFDNDYTNAEMEKWLKDNFSQVITSDMESMSLGDSYLFVNPDTSISTLSPDTVTPIVDEKDYSKVIGWSVRNVYTHPTRLNDVMIITEEFTKEFRTRKIEYPGVARFGKFKSSSSQPRIVTERFKNLTGKIPVIHIPNRNTASEKFGRPEVDAMLHLLYEYDEVMTAATHGNKKQGRPTPVFSGLGSSIDVDKFYEKYAKTIRRTLANGDIESEEVFEFDSDKAVILGGTANFKWEAPGSFTKDTQVMLGLFFYIIIQHTEIPEYALGTAVEGNKASVGTQVEPLTKFIDYRRHIAETWLKQLFDVVLATKALSDSRIKTDIDKLVMKWSQLTREDGALVLKAVQWAYSNGFLDDVEALRHTPIDIVDAEKTVKAGHDGFPDRVGTTSTKNGTFEKQSKNDPEIDKNLPVPERASSQ